MGNRGFSPITRGSSHFWFYEGRFLAAACVYGGFEGGSFFSFVLVCWGALMGRKRGLWETEEIMGGEYK